MLRNDDSHEPQVFFSRRPTQQDRPVELPLIRVPPTGISKVLILSNDVTGTNLHYWRGRSEPCHGDGCEACLDGQMPRWRGYVVMMSTRTKQKGLLELTAAAMDPIDEYFAEHGTLRGAELAISRSGGKPNGKLSSTIKFGGLPAGSLPTAPELEGILLRLWGYSTDDTQRGDVERKIRRDRHGRGDWGLTAEEVKSGIS